MTNLRDVAITGPLDSFGELLEVQRTPLIELKSAVPDVSELRNDTFLTGSASISVVSSEYRLRCTAAGADSAILDSAEKGRYIPGYGAEAGIGIRVPAGQTYAATQEAKWGYFDGTNGFGFGVDATGTFIFIQRNGAETKVYQANWNVDTADGSGGSGLTLDLERGNIFQIRFTWYGYGTINFQILLPDATSDQGLRTVTVHRITPAQETSVEQPNLQLRIHIDNAGEASTQDLFVGGRQFSIIGRYDPNRRLTSEIRIGGPSGVGTTWTPIITFRRKAGVFNNQSVKLSDIDILTSADAFVGVFTNVSLVGASYGTPTDVLATETVLESDVAAGSFTGGLLLLRRIVKGGSSATNRPLSKISAPEFDIIGNDPITLAIRSITGTVDVSSAVFELQEEW